MGRQENDVHRDDAWCLSEKKFMNYKRLFYPECHFGGFTDVDGTIVFANRVNSLLKPEYAVLDVGCGRGVVLEDPIPLHSQLCVFKGKVAKVIGIDVDQAAAENPVVDEFHLIREDEPWPLKDHSIDLCWCDSVLEHIRDPAFFFLQARRVIRPGGYLCIRTPNLFSYFGAVARFIPAKFHASIVTRVQEGRQARDVFPTFYRCNSKWKLRQYLTKHGFDAVVYGYEAEPSYLSFSLIAYACGVLHQKLAPNFMRNTLFAFAQRK